LGVEYEEFVNERLASLLRYAVMLTGDVHTAQDVVQDTAGACRGVTWTGWARPRTTWPPSRTSSPA
jgi:hypothetical protein